MHFVNVFFKKISKYQRLKPWNEYRIRFCRALNMFLVDLESNSCCSALSPTSINEY